MTAARPVLLPQPRSIEVGASIVPARIIATSTSPALPPQGYRLVADERGVTILGADPAGVSYAQATLAQLVGLYGDQIPALRIEDWPDLAIRGVMLDISRDKVPTMATLKALIARLASWKVNHVQLYMEHTFAYPGHREVWAKADPLTADEIDELDRYCRELHVELAPNQNCLGHMERWLAHPRYRPLAILPERPRTEERKYPAPRPTTLDPAHPGSLALVRELLADLLPHFGSKRVNVGLDEPWELPAERFADYVAYVRALRALEVLGGREMLMWGDILAPHPEVLDALPHGVTVCDWGYEADHPFEERAARLRAAGREFWLCPGTSSWNSLVGRWTNARLNILAAAVAAAKHGAAALLNTDWGDRGHLQYLPVSEPGFAYGAAVSWCLDSNHDLDVAAALDAHAFHDGAREVGGALLRLADLYREVPAIHNRSLLTQPLYERDERVGTGSSAGLTHKALETVERKIEETLASLDDSRIERDDGALVLAELRTAGALLAHLVRNARLRLAGDGTLGSVPRAARESLARELAPLIEQHRERWLARNRPGGLSDSAAWLERLLGDYRAS